MFFDKNQFAFTANLESNWLLIRQELEQLDRNYFHLEPSELIEQKGWKSFGMFSYGRKCEHYCQLCPQTTKLLRAIPGMTTAGFSALTAGAYIKPHASVLPDTLRCHLGLIIPDDCAIRVGDETRTWQEGQCLVFDETVEHEAWNNSARTRIVLLIGFNKSQALNSTILNRLLGLVG